MRSDICKIHQGSEDLAEILRECERVAVYNGLEKKAALHLRLLCEELDGMLPLLIGDFEGQFYIDFENGVCKVVASIEIDELSSESKDRLIGIAKTKKNAAAVGVVGKIRSAVESFFLDMDFSGAYTLPTYGIESASLQYLDVAYSQYWSLNSYKEKLDKENEPEAWDELERSVIASVADDVIVGVKGRRADIIIVKNFNGGEGK